MAIKWLFRFLGVLVFVMIGFLVFLCFFQFPAMDDYVGSYLTKYHGGLQPAISKYLTLGNGRFASIPLFLSISSSKYLMNHYAFILIFFILLTLFSVFCFVRMLHSRLFDGKLPVNYTIGITGMILMVFLYVVPEVASFFFWMATSTTYLISLCVFLFLLLGYTRLLSKDQKNRNAWLISTSLLTVIAAGCNEVTLFYGFALPSIILFVYAVSRKKVPGLVFFLIGLNILLVLLITQNTGLKERADHYTPKQSMFTSAAGAAYRTAQSLLPVFSNPLFYVSCLGIYISSGNLQASFLQRISFKKTHWFMECGIILALIFLFQFVVRQFAGEIVPLRASNIMNCLSILGFWWVILANANRAYNLSWVQSNKAVLTKAFLVLFIVTLTFSPFTGQLFKNVIAAPVHAQVLKQREAAIWEAKNSRRKAVVIHPYAVEVKAILEQRFSAKKRFISEENFLPPSFSYFMDEPVHPSQTYFYAEYYGIDSIITDQGTYKRWSLVGNGAVFWQ